MEAKINQWNSGNIWSFKRKDPLLYSIAISPQSVLPPKRICGGEGVGGKREEVEKQISKITCSPHI